MSNLLLKNGTLITPEGRKEADLLIENGKIAKISKDIVADGAEVIDCEGQIVMPGVIDTHVHLREPGVTEAEDFITGSKAAARGGVTTFLDMPNNKPLTDSVANLEAKYELAEGRMVCNYGFFIAATGENILELKKADRAIGVKLFMSDSTDIAASGDLDEIFEFLQEKPLTIHAEDKDRIEARKKQFAGVKDPEVHSLIRDDDAAYLAVKKALDLQKKYGTRLHVAHMSSAKEVAELRKFKNEKVTAEVTTHHLFLTTDAYAEKGSLVQMNPPLRKVGDKDALWDGVRDGLIDNVVTDHAPHTLAAKGLSYGEAPSGVPGLETLLPLMLDSVNHGEISLERCVEVLCSRPAEIFGLSRKGRLEIGCDADVVVVDMEREENVGEKGYQSKCGWSPYDGWRLKGWPVLTVVNGEVVMKGGAVEEKFVGEAVA
ncbi:MAG: dihydroorotase [Patescibacteria group bacterium]|nr:dihydroorotase [Patescibacteria group bacterium]